MQRCFIVEQMPAKVANKQQKGQNAEAKPFLKWAGGKGQLLREIELYYPFDNLNITKYAEPFVGGGAVLFDILNRYNLTQVYINDINEELINAYRVVRDNVNRLITLLTKFQEEYVPLVETDRRNYYLAKRDKFNKLKIHQNNRNNIEKAALLIFLNKTCFNGLYRVNRKGFFNVPIGAYKNPIICDSANLRIVSKKLENIVISCGDYKQAEKFIDEKTFVYFDPPYRPLTETASFTSYTEGQFDDEQQKELATFVEKMDRVGAKIVISNSDPKNTDEKDNFFDTLYAQQNIKRIEASRMINRNSNSRGKIKELLISNF